MSNNTMKALILALALLVAGVAVVSAGSPNLMIGTDMGHTDFYLFNMDTDQRIKVDLSKDPLWPGGGALHTINGKKAYLSVMSSDKDPATFLALQIDALDWKAGTADVKITKVMRAAARPSPAPRRHVGGVHAWPPHTPPPSPPPPCPSRRSGRGGRRCGPCGRRDVGRRRR